MKTIQMTIDEHLLEQVDSMIQELGVSRSSFMRGALQQALRQIEIRNLEQQHIAGYEKHPISPDEFDIWQEEQIWEDAV